MPTERNPVLVAEVDTARQDTRCTGAKVIYEVQSRDADPQLPRQVSVVDDRGR